MHKRKIFFASRLRALLLGLILLAALAPGAAQGAFCVYQYHWGLSWSEDASTLMFHSYQWNPNSDAVHNGRENSDLWLLHIEDGSTIQVPREQPTFREPANGRLYVTTDLGLSSTLALGGGWTRVVPFPGLAYCFNPNEDTITGRGVWDGTNHVEILSSTSGAQLGRAMAESPYNSLDKTGLNAVQYYDSTRQVLVELNVITGEELMVREVSRDEIQNRWIRRMNTDIEPAGPPRDCIPFEVPDDPLEFVAGDMAIQEATQVIPLEPPISPEETITETILELGQGTYIERRGPELWFHASNGAEQRLVEPEPYMERPARLVEAVKSPDGALVALLLESNLHLPKPVGGIRVLEITTGRELATVPWRQLCANEFGE